MSEPARIQGTRSQLREALQSFEGLGFRVNDANRFVPREHRLSINTVECSAHCFYCRSRVSSRLCEVDHGQVPPAMCSREWDMRHFGPLDQQLRGFFEVLLITPPNEEFGKLDVLRRGCTLQVGIVGLFQTMRRLDEILPKTVVTSFVR